MTGALGFRVFFLMAAMFAIAAVGLWALSLNDAANLAPYGGWRFWHAHEMLFGYSAAVVAGFLLTAVRSWTGLNTASGWQLIPLAGIWLAARALMLAGQTAAGLLIFLDLLFWFYLAVILAKPIIIKRQYRNLFALVGPLLLLFASAIGHMGLRSQQPAWENAGLYGGLMIITVLMSLIGARVIPMFTRNSTGVSALNTPRWLNRVIGILLWLIALMHLVPGLSEPYALPLSLGMLLTGLLILIRMTYWHFPATLQYPLLWSLHLAYAFIPAGLILLGLYHAGMLSQPDGGVHAITVGAIGGLTLSMMARVSLGHTGRQIQSEWSLTLVFVMILTAGIVRVLTPFMTGQSLTGWSLSALLWLLAFLLFTWRFLPVWLQPRVDGKPG